MSFRYLVSILLGFSLPFLFFNKKDAHDFEENEEKEAYPTDWFYAQRAYPNEYIDQESYRQALNQAFILKEKQALTRGLAEWQFAGPTNIGGRLSSIAIHPSEPQTFYAGAAAGGVFKTTDNGKTWKPIFDNQPALAIGDIDIAPSNAKVVYVGTGEANGGGGSINYEGLGIFKSTDAGTTWQKVGLDNIGTVGRIAIDPTNANRVFVAAMGYLYQKTSNRGIYRTLDGGASWKQVLYVSDSTGGIDIAFHPTKPDIIYAAMWERTRTHQTRNYGGPTGGIFKSADGGTTWTKLTNGLPPNDFGRIGIAISPKDPSVIYALMTNPTGFFKGVYKTIDGGTTWTQVDLKGNLVGMFSNFGWWMCRIVADPNNANRAYALGLNIYRTEDGGTTWVPVSTPASVHVDQHDLYINPNTGALYSANDGGFYASTDDAKTWQFVNNLPVTQFYSCERDEKNPSRLFGGTQDNGTVFTNAGKTDDWKQIFGGDGFVCLVDPNDNRYVYAESQFGYIGRSQDGGATFDEALEGIDYNERHNWNTPIVFSPDNSSILYTATMRLYKTTDRALTWKPISPDLTKGFSGDNGVTYGTISTISVSPKDPKIIYVGTDDGNAWITKDGGTTWKLINIGLPNRYITNITADPFDVNVAYLTLSGFRWRESEAHVFKTSNQGTNWQDISTNLPDAPVNDIEIDPSARGTLYVATDFGVYYSINDGKLWQPIGTGLPLVAVLDIKLHNPTRKLIAGTFGRSMYTYSALPTASQELDNQYFNLKINPTILTQNAIIELKIPANQTVHLDIFDLNGRHVKTLQNSILTEGAHQFTINRLDMPASGVYILKMQVKEGFKSLKFLVL